MTRRSPEGDLQRNIIELAEMLGWRAYHVARVKGQLRARTSPGFPDLVMVRAPRLIFAELKAPGKHLTPEQLAWRAELKKVETTEVYGPWRPGDWDAIATTLQRKEPQ